MCGCGRGPAGSGSTSEGRIFFRGPPFHGGSADPVSIIVSDGPPRRISRDMLDGEWAFASP